MYNSRQSLTRFLTAGRYCINSYTILSVVTLKSQTIAQRRNEELQSKSNLQCAFFPSLRVSCRVLLALSALSGDMIPVDKINYMPILQGKENCTVLRKHRSKCKQKEI